MVRGRRVMGMERMMRSAVAAGAESGWKAMMAEEADHWGKKRPRLMSSVAVQEVGRLRGGEGN